MERDTKGRFAKGHISNGGRPRGLAERCREATHDGADIVTLMLQALKGEMEDCKSRDRLDAAEWFADRGWGKATQFVEQSSSGELVVRVIRVAGTAKSDG